MHFERNVNRAAIFALTFLSAPKVTPIASASLPLIPLVCPTQSYDYQAQISLHQDIQKRIDRNNDNLLDAKYASTRIKNASISDAPSFERAAYVVSKMNHYVILRAGHVTQRDFEDRCAEYKQLYDHALTTQTERSLPANQVAAGVVFGVGSLIPQISTLSKFLGVGSNGALGTASLFAGYSPIEKEARSRQRYAESTSALDTNLLFAAELSKMSPELKSQYALILEGQGVIPKDTWGIGSVGFSKALGENTSFPQLPQATEAGLSASSKTSVEKLRRINTGAKVPSDDKANVDVTAQTEAQKPSLKDKVAQLELEMNASGTPEVKLQKNKELDQARFELRNENLAKYTKIAEDCRTTRETLALAELAADLIPAGKGRENAKKAIALGTFTCDLVEKVSAFNLIDGVGALSSLTDIGGSAKRLFQVLAGGGNDGIKAEIQAMREDLQKTREQMHQRFDRIEIQIDELHDAIDDGFNAVLSDTKDIKTTLSNVIDRLERIEYKTDQISAALSKISELNIQMSDREIQESVFPTIDITPVEIGDISKAISFYINLGSSVATSPALFPKTADTAVGNSSSTPISIADLRNEIRPAVDGPLPGVTQIGYNASLNDVIFKLADVLGKDPLVSNNKGVIELVKFRDDLKFGNKRVPNELLWRYSVDQLERVLLNHPNAITQIIASDSVSKDPQPLIDAGQTIIRAHTLLRSTELLAALYQVYERESTNLCDSMLDWERSWKQKKHIRDFNLWQSDSPPSAYDGLADEFSGSFELKHINRTAVLAVPGDLTAKLPMEIRSWVKHGYGSIRGRWEVDFAQTARQVDIDTERGNKKSTEYDATFYLTLILSFEPKLPDGSGLTPVEFMRSQLAVEKSNWRYDSNKYYTFNYFWDQWENPKRANFKETFTARASHTVNQGNITAIRTSLAPWADAVRQSYNADIAKAISSDDKSLSEEGALGESILRIRGISRAIDAAVRLGYPDGENDDTIAACLNGKNRIPDQGIFAEFGSRYSSWQSTDPSLVNSPLYIFFAQQSRSAFGYSDGWCLPGAAINSTFCRSLPGADELEEISQYAELPISAANVIESRERNEALRQGLRLDLPVRQVVTLEGGVAFMLPKSNQSTGLTQHLLALKIVNGMESPIPLVEEGLQVLRGIKTVVMKK